MTPSLLQPLGHDRRRMLVDTRHLWNAAHEVAAGVRVGTGLLATRDIDILPDARARLRLTAEGDAPRGVLQILQLVDWSFAPTGGRGFCAVNRDGFQVDLIKPEPNPPWKE